MTVQKIQSESGENCFICELKESKWDWSFPGEERKSICSDCKSAVTEGGKTGNYPSIDSAEELKNAALDGYLRIIKSDIPVLRTIGGIEKPDVKKETLNRTYKIQDAAIERLKNLWIVLEDDRGINISALGAKLLKRLSCY